MSVIKCGAIFVISNTEIGIARPLLEVTEGEEYQGFFAAPDQIYSAIGKTLLDYTEAGYAFQALDIITEDNPDEEPVKRVKVKMTFKEPNGS